MRNLKITEKGGDDNIEFLGYANSKRTGVLIGNSHGTLSNVLLSPEQLEKMRDWIDARLEEIRKMSISRGE